jgi:hypothetical protein
MSADHPVIAGLANPETWWLIVTVALFGALGGIAQHVTARDPEVATRWWVAAVVGIVAALGVLWVDPPATAVAQIAQSLLAGFLGRSLIEALQARIIAAVEKERRQRATAIARDSLALLEQRATRLDGDRSAPGGVDGDAAVLRARLADVEPRRRSEVAP